MELKDLTDKQQQALWEAYMRAIEWRLKGPQRSMMPECRRGHGTHSCPLCQTVCDVSNAVDIQYGQDACEEICPANGTTGDGLCDRFVVNRINNKDSTQMLRRKLAQLSGSAYGGQKSSTSPSGDAELEGR